MDSVGDTSADDLLRFVYDLAFRQPSGWGWTVAGGFVAVPGWLALVSLIERNLLSAAVFATMCGVILGLRVYLLRKIGYPVFAWRKKTPEYHAGPFDIDG